MKFQKLDVKKVEHDLNDMIKKLGLKGITVSWVKDFTYNFDLPTNQVSTKYFKVLMDKLPRSVSQADFDKVMQIFNDAWNAFPQKVMDGMSPQDKMFESIEQEKQKERNNPNNGPISPISDEMLEKHFTYAEKNLDDYMDWAYKEILPKYDKYIKGLKLGKEKEREHIGVAGVFLEMCGQMGMFEFDRLPPDFIADFPDMFQKTVIGPNIPKDQIKLYLESLFLFLDTFYAIKVI